VVPGTRQNHARLRAERSPGESENVGLTVMLAQMCNAALNRLLVAERQGVIV